MGRLPQRYMGSRMPGSVERASRTARHTIVLRMAVVLLLAVAACGTGTPVEVGPAQAALRWERLPDPPLSPRFLPALHWTGSELLALGGDTVPPCPPAASCVNPAEPQRDGAAYDPATGRWRRTAEAPRPLGGGAVVDGDVVWAQTGWEADAPLLSYDASEDRWTQQPAPPGPPTASYGLAVSEGRPVALRREQRTQRYPDAVYDPHAGTWESLPPDPLAPSFDRAAVQTPHGLLVSGAEAVPNPGSDQPSYLRAMLLDVTTKTWQRLPDSDQLIGAGIAVHGDRAIWPDLGGADGGAVNGYGRTIPFGGVLNVATGAWQPLPHSPAEGTGGWAAYALGGAVSATEGYLYDDRNGSWTPLPRPQDSPPHPGAAGWADEDLVVIGGTTEPIDRYERVQGAWVLRGAGR